MKPLKTTAQILYIIPCSFLCLSLLGLIEVKAIITFLKYALITIILSAACSDGMAQKQFKQYDVCIASETHKGKINHGKSYCVGHATVKEYKDGRKDTIAWTYSCQPFIGDEYEEYKKLSERSKYIIDSLKEDGITQLNDSYLTYEPYYMKYGKKTEQLWSTKQGNVMIYQYLFWHNSKGSGIELLKEFEVK